MSGGGGGQTGGQQTWTDSPWVGPAFGAAGLGLALAGRRGSPASGLGTGILAQLASTYADRAITAGDRQRKMEQEDEARRLRFAEVMMNSGSMRPTRPGEQPLERLNFAGREIGLVPTERLNPMQYGTGLGTALGLTPEEVTTGLGQLSGSPEQQIAQMQAIIPQLAQRKRERSAGSIFAGLARPVKEPSLTGGFEQPEGLTREPTTIQPGTPGILRPQEAATLSAIAAMPGGYETAMRELASIMTQRARQTTPDELAAMLDQARGFVGGAGRNLALGVHGGPQGTSFSLTERPDAWQRQDLEAQRENVKATAKEIAGSQQWNTVLAQVGKQDPAQAQIARQELSRALASGYPDALANFYNNAKLAKGQPPSELENILQAIGAKNPQLASEIRLNIALKAGGMQFGKSELLSLAKLLQNEIEVGQYTPDEKAALKQDLAETIRRLSVNVGIRKEPTPGQQAILERAKKEGWDENRLRQELDKAARGTK